MGADQEPIQCSSNVAGSNSFVAPSEGVVLRLDVREAPLRNKVLQPFSKGIPNLSSTSTLFCGDSDVEVSYYEEREEHFPFTLFLKGVPKTFFLCLDSWTIDITYPEHFFIFLIF